MKKYNTEALVLKCVNYKDADRIYTLLTKDVGKITAVARGVRKISSRRSGNLDSLNLVSVKITENSNGYRSIDEVETLDSHKRVKNDYAASITAYYLAELVHRSIEEDSSVPEVYDLIISSLKSLANDYIPPKLVSAHFEVMLLKILGYDINYLSAPISESDKATLGTLKENSWTNLASEQVSRVEVIIKSYIYSYLVDQIKSLEIAKLS